MTEPMTAERLYSEYRSKVSGYIFSRVKNRADAEDLVSDVFVKIVENFDKYDSEKASYSTWVFTITRNTVISYFRQAREFDDITEMELADPDSEESLNEVVLKEDIRTLAGALQRMSDRDRDIIIARYYYDRSFREIGDMLGITEANARVAHGRAIQKLRTEFGGAAV